VLLECTYIIRLTGESVKGTQRQDIIKKTKEYINFLYIKNYIKISK